MAAPRSNEPFGRGDLTGVVIDDRYRLVRRLGAGGMGVVYEGEHDEERVAIKVLRNEFAYHETFRKRFLREAQAICRIKHENVVDIVDFGVSNDNVVWIAMELLTGRDLRQWLDRTPKMPWRTARDMLGQIAAGLGAAHAHGIVHRDVKPANCFVSRSGDGPPRIKLLDFGVAKVLSETFGSRGLTGADELIGTVAYMAPELTMGKPAEVRSDVYAVGVLAFEMIAGQKPFVGKDMFEVMSKHARETPPPLSSLVPDVPPELESIVLRALAKEPDHRFSTMEELRIALLGVPDTGAGDFADDDGELPTRLMSKPSTPVQPLPRAAPTVPAVPPSSPESELPTAVEPVIGSGAHGHTIVAPSGPWIPTEEAVRSGLTVVARPSPSEVAAAELALSEMNSGVPATSSRAMLIALGVVFAVAAVLLGVLLGYWITSG